MSLSTNATKLLAWFTRYNTTATAYNNYLVTRAPRAQRRGAFNAAFYELYSQGY